MPSRSGGGLVFAAPSYAVHQTVYGLTDEDPSRIVTFAVGAPQAATGPVVLADASGLPLPLTDDNLVGIDYRPRTNTLYGASDNGVLYRIAPPTAMAPQFRATSLGTITDPADVASGFGFNPAADRLRLSNVNDDNLRIDVDARTTTMDGVLAFAVGDANFGANPRRSPPPTTRTRSTARPRRPCSTSKPAATSSSTRRRPTPAR